MRRIGILLLLGGASLASAASADEVILKGGRRLTGVVVEKTARHVVIEVGPGRVSVPQGQVERIESGASALANYRARVAALDPRDAAGWLELGFWAREAGLETQAQEALARAVALDPDNVEAHRALGHVRLGERWATLEESYRAQGLVPFEGAWISAGEREAILRERAQASLADHLRQEAEARTREAEARTRAAEAEARRAAAAQADASGGIPYGFVLAGGCGTGNCGHRSHWRPRRTAPPPPPEPAPKPVTGSIH